MQQTAAVAALLKQLDIDREPAPPSAILHEMLGPPAAFGVEATVQMKRLLRTNPAIMLAAAPAQLGSSPTLAEGARLLDDAEALLQRPEITMAAIAAHALDEPPYELPVEHRFEGYDSAEIPIFPNQQIFEEPGDNASWVLTAVAAWWFRLTHDKPDMPRHSVARPFVYPLVTADEVATVALPVEGGRLRW